MKKMPYIVLFLLGVIWSFAASAAEQSKWGNLKFITTPELKRMMDAQEDFLLINALSPIEHAELRISGSINIPYVHLKKGLAQLPDDKNKKLVFYCKGPK